MFKVIRMCFFCIFPISHSNPKIHLSERGLKKSKGMGFLHGCCRTQRLRVRSSPQPPPHRNLVWSSRIGFLRGLNSGWTNGWTHGGILGEKYISCHHDVVYGSDFKGMRWGVNGLVNGNVIMGSVYFWYFFVEGHEMDSHVALENNAL